MEVVRPEKQVQQSPSPMATVQLSPAKKTKNRKSTATYDRALRLRTSRTIQIRSKLHTEFIKVYKNK